MIAFPLYNPPHIAYNSTLVGESVLTQERTAPTLLWCDKPASGTHWIVEGSQRVSEFDWINEASFRDLMDKIIEVRLDEDEDVPPTNQAMIRALRVTSLARQSLAHRWRLPRVATDGYGGLRLSWRKGSQELRAVIAPSSDFESYLYWEDLGSYGSIGNFTAATLFTYLDKLENEIAFAD